MLPLRRGDANERCAMETSSGSTCGWTKWVRKRRLEGKITRQDGPAANPAPRKHHSGAMGLGDGARVSSTSRWHLWDTDDDGGTDDDCAVPDDWEVLVTNNSRAISVGKKSKREVHGTQWRITRKDGPPKNPAPREHHSRAMALPLGARGSFTTVPLLSPGCDTNDDGGLDTDFDGGTDDDGGVGKTTNTSRAISVGKQKKLVHGTQPIRTAREDDDDDFEELVTSTSRVSFVGKKMKREVHGTQRRIRMARGRLFRSGGRAPCTVQKLQRLSPCPRKLMLLKGRGEDMVREMGSPAEIISLVHGIDSSGDVHLSPSFMNQDSSTSNLDVKQSNLTSLEHSLANKDDEEEDTSSMEFFDDCDCSGQSLKIYVDELCSGSSNVDELCTVSLTAWEKLQLLTLDHKLPFSWELKVVKALDIVHRRALTEFNTEQFPVHTRFCDFNIAFFDHDKESEMKHETPFHKIHPSRHRLLDGAVNVISIKVAKSDVPINIYGTVLARDRNDYRCVYLFKRGRDNPQLMTKRNRMLALTGPYRALGAAGTMYFEFHLKIKGKEETDDQDFCKGLLARNPFRSTLPQPCTYSLESCPSTVNMVCMPIQFALEASLEVNVLNDQSFFTGKISAWTSANDQNKTILDNETEIVLYDSKVPGTKIKLETGGSISLSRRIVAVPLKGDLFLKISVWENRKLKHCEVVLGHDVEDHVCKLGPYELQVKIIWSGVFRQELPKLWKRIGDSLVFW